MCEHVIQNSYQIKPGSYMTYTINEGKVIAGIWGLLGIGDSIQTNIRIEMLRSVWKDYLPNRGILEINGFFGGDTYFKSVENLKVPVIFDDNYDFAIVTRSAKGLVGKSTNRQPLLIKVGQEKAWLEEGVVIQVSVDDLMAL